MGVLWYFIWLAVAAAMVYWFALRTPKPKEPPPPPPPGDDDEDDFNPLEKYFYDDIGLDGVGYDRIADWLRETYGVDDDRKEDG